MRRITAHLLVALLTCAIGMRASGLFSNEQPPRPVESKSTFSASSREVKCPPVPFKYNPELASSVEAEVVPELLDGKPGDIVPEYLLFALRDNQHRDRGSIKVFPVVKYRKSMTTYSNQQAAVTSPTIDWVPYLDDQVRTLKTLVKEKPLAEKLVGVLDTNRVGINKGQMPFLPLYDAHLAFHGSVKYLSFQNGKGVGFLTQWDTETFPITNEGLTYLFQGITDDGEYYVSAQFSLKAPVLQSGSEPEVVAWYEKNYLLSPESREYQAYLRTIVPKLEALPSDKFEPNLALIEQLIQSIRIDVEPCQQ